ncbi:choline-sulfatase [Haloferula helveola]|uniref:Choline-sulfatase n=1 Tax=Haloferula helveola TaxID=490095 RepID=A0ABM7R7J3_9BACT|nr:choline-sulfatase [Haloferula helveola]
MKRLVLASLVLLLPLSAAERPNVLLIAVDDLNDWIGCLGGHPQALTPNMDALAGRGVLFSNAHCQSPVCNPSRASLMTSLYPETSGIYFLNPPIEASPVSRKSLTMPERFEKEGYRVAAAGKLFHAAENAKYFKDYGGGMGGMGPRPKKKISQPHGHPLWDWGAFPEKDEEMPDHKIAAWAADRIGSMETDRPFFLAVGFHRPHVPMFVPQKWFDMHPLKKVKLPKVLETDLDDLSPYAIDITRLKHVAPTHEWIKEAGEWRHAVQSYLACVTFVDDCVGTVLKALDSSPFRDNTIVVLFSDHGFHLGEKDRWAKRTVWEDSTRVPVIIVPPGGKGGAVCTQPAELIDLYPTLLDLTGSKPDERLEGQSLRPLLEDVKAEWPHMARTSFGPGNVAIRSERYRFIRYVDGSEEFYDHADDPHEWKNRIEDPALAERIGKHRDQLPGKNAKILGKGATGHISYAASAERLEERKKEAK